MYTSKTRKDKFSSPGKNCQRNVTDLTGSLVTISRPPGCLQKRPDDRTSNAGVQTSIDCCTQLVLQPLISPFTSSTPPLLSFPALHFLSRSGPLKSCSLGTSVSFPCGPGQSPVAKRFYMHFESKITSSCNMNTTRI